MNSRKVNSIQLKASSHANFKMFFLLMTQFSYLAIAYNTLTCYRTINCSMLYISKLLKAYDKEIKRHMISLYCWYCIFIYYKTISITPGTLKYNHSLLFIINKNISKTINIKHWKNIPMDSCLKKIRHMFKYWDDQRKQENSHKWIL